MSVASGHPFVEDVLGRATAPGHGVRQALRMRFPGGIGKDRRRGVLMHFLWDPARVFPEESAARLARTVFPVLSIPVVVSIAETIPALRDGLLGEALILDALATFEVR